MKVGRLADLCQRQAGLSRPLEALATLLANVLQLALRSLDFGLGTPHLCARLLRAWSAIRHGAYSPAATPSK